MGLTYFHLGESNVREAMVAAWREEWDDLSANWPRGSCYGKQLTDQGWDAFERAMPEALANRDDDWLLEQMSVAAYWVPTLTRRTKSDITQVEYNKSDALEKLTVGEFNIAYIRGLAQALTARGDVSALCTEPTLHTFLGASARLGRIGSFLWLTFWRDIGRATFRHLETGWLGQCLLDPTVTTASELSD